jgi:alpha-L-rhamnosidase
MFACTRTVCRREKHGWLADSQVTAEEAMYNLWIPGIYSRYLSQIRDSQSVTGPNKGFVASRVPGRAPSTIPAFGLSANGNDVSWSAAYPLDASFLLRYYGDLASVAEHWPTLMLYMDSQLRVANGPTYDNSTSRGLPDFYYWGDWCAVEPRAKATPGTGPQAAAANFLMALRAMVEIGIGVGDSANAARYNTTWSELVPRFHRRFWNASLGTWASDTMELQTLTALSLAAGIGSKTDRASAVAALDRDVQTRGYHLTVGSAGVKWLLRTLSKEGKHDTALQLAMQTTFPSWGWWLGQGATTCWESWSGVADPSHVSHPTHNHVRVPNADFKDLQR